MNKLLEALQSVELYDHPVRGFSILETHISWVLLTGPYAYKLKKPVRFGFVDFSTGEKRRYYCHEELRLNRRLAPDLYTGVVAIGGSVDGPWLAPDTGRAPPEGAFEYAVKMRQFPGDALAAQLVEDGRLTGAHIDRLAECVGDFHTGAASAAGDGPYGNPESIQRWTLENFGYFGALPPDPLRDARIQALRQWVVREFERRYPQFERRKAGGYIRECHGDLHLGNIVVLDDDPVPFDCIEFNDELRWVDVLSDVAFLAMDLYDHGRPALARRFLNRYLTRTGDYAGLALLRYYLVYRSLVRAKVAALGAAESDGREMRAATADCDSYLELAAAFCRPDPPLIVVTRGYSGSGKSYLAARLAEAMEAIHVRSDVERKRRFGYAALDDTGSAVGAGIYGEQATQETYESLLQHAESIVGAGYTAIVDAAFLRREQRRGFRRLAETLNVPWTILSCEAPVDVLKSRIELRRRTEADPSEADVAVLESQLDFAEPFDRDERRAAVVVNTVMPPPLEEIVRKLRDCAAGG